MYLMRVPTFLFILIFIFSCTTKYESNSDMYAACGSSYSTSDINFTESDVLKFRFRIVYFADSANEPIPNYDSIMTTINTFYKQMDMQFTLLDTMLVVDSDKKNDMPSFIKYHMKDYKDDCYITMYIYGDNQDNYPPDLSKIAGSAGGIGSNFFAVRRMFANNITPIHELGHVLSLMHTNTYDKSETGYTLYSGDKVCDSRKVEDYTDISDPDCNYIGSVKLSASEAKEIICNVMSHNYFHCRGCVTNGQIRRARFYVHESPKIQIAIYEGLNKQLTDELRRDHKCN